MSEVTAALPRKILTSGERDFLKQGDRLLLAKPNGRIGAAALMDLVADWGNYRGSLAFQEYARRRITEGQAKNKIADQLLRELFGLNEPDPRKAA